MISGKALSYIHQSKPLSWESFRFPSLPPSCSFTSVLGMDPRACFKPSTRLDIVSVGRRGTGTVGAVSGTELGNSPDCCSGETCDRKRLEYQTARRERWWTEVAPVRVRGAGGFSRFVYWEEQMWKRRLQCRRSRRAYNSSKRVRESTLGVRAVSKVTRSSLCQTSEGEARRRDLGLHTSHSIPRGWQRRQATADSASG